MASIIEQQAVLWAEHDRADTDAERMRLEKRIRDLERRKPHGMVELVRIIERIKA